MAGLTLGRSILPPEGPPGRVREGPDESLFQRATWAPAPTRRRMATFGRLAASSIKEFTDELAAGANGEADSCRVGLAMNSGGLD